ASRICIVPASRRARRHGRNVRSVKRQAEGERDSEYQPLPPEQTAWLAAPRAILDCAPMSVNDRRWPEATPSADRMSRVATAIFKPKRTPRQPSLSPDTRGQMRIPIRGAGPAGAAAGWHLATRGYAVTLVDAAPFPRDKTCGDRLTPLAPGEPPLPGS